MFSSTVHGLQGRVDSLEKSNSKLIEEVRQYKYNTLDAFLISTIEVCWNTEPT